MAAASKWQDEYIRMLDDCAARSPKMTEWEQEFTASLKRYLVEEHGFPSVKQINRLTIIWEKVTDKG